MGGGGLEYLKSAEGILDQWEVLFAMYFVITFIYGYGGYSYIDDDAGNRNGRKGGHHNENRHAYHDGHLAWLIIIGILGLISLIFLILKAFGVSLPEMLLKVFYIIGAVLSILMAFVIIILCCVSSATDGLPLYWTPTPLNLCFCLGVFYIYSAVSGGGK